MWIFEFIIKFCMGNKILAKFFYVCKHGNLFAPWYYMHAQLSGRKFLWPNVNRNIIDSQSACVHVLNLPKIDLNSAWFQKFGQVVILIIPKILLHIHLTMSHTCLAPQFCRQTPKIASTSVKTVFCAKFGQKNYNISCLCSNVWQKCNVETVFNIVVSSFENCTYLYNIQAPEVNALINVHSVHVNCVPKTSPRRPKWKRIFPGF